MKNQIIHKNYSDLKQSIYLTKFELDMRARHHRNDSDVFKIQSYNSIRDQLEQQNANLLRERQMIQQQLQPTQVYHHNTNNSFGDQGKFQQDFSPIQINASPHKSPSQKTFYGTLKNKISEIIDLCQGQGGNNQFNEVAEAEKQILGFLQNLPNNQGNNVESSPHKNSKRKKTKLNKTQVYDNHKESFRNLLGDEAMELIEQIERKALVEIQNLRNDKINLMKRLNQQIKAHNEQKRLRIGHQNQSKRFNDHRRDQRSNRMDVIDEQNQQSYQTNIPIQNFERQHENQQIRKRPSQTKNYSNFHPSQNNQQIHQKNTYVLPQNPNIPVQQGQVTKLPNPKTQNVRYSINEAGPRGQYQSQQQVLQQMDRVRQQNQRMKQLMGENNANPNVKNQLRSELSQLENKIYQYEQLLTKQRMGKGFDLGQFQNLMNEANYISQEGQRILKTKRPADNRTTAGSYGFEQARFSAPEVTNERRVKTGRFEEVSEEGGNYSRPPLQTFSPMDKSSHGQNYKFSSGFSPTEYEKLIEEMSYVAKI